MQAKGRKKLFDATSLRTLRINSVVKIKYCFRWAAGMNSPRRHGGTEGPWVAWLKDCQDSQLMEDLPVARRQDLQTNQAHHIILWIKPACGRQGQRLNPTTPICCRRLHYGKILFLKYQGEGAMVLRELMKFTTETRRHGGSPTF